MSRWLQGIFNILSLKSFDSVDADFFLPGAFIKKADAKRRCTGRGEPEHYKELLLKVLPALLYCFFCLKRRIASDENR